ncbi:MAG: DUF3081 family protein [Pseudomonadota bacterium]
MDSKINIKQALRVFFKISEKGEAQDDNCVLHGLKAQSDMDGYTITIADDYVTLRILFHNQFKLDYPNQKALATFMERMATVDRKY